MSMVINTEYGMNILIQHKQYTRTDAGSASWTPVYLER